MKRYNLFLPDEMIAALKNLARLKGTTSSEIIRFSVAQHLKQHPLPSSAPTPDGQHSVNGTDLG